MTVAQVCVRLMDAGEVCKHVGEKALPTGGYCAWQKGAPESAAFWFLVSDG